MILFTTSSQILIKYAGLYLADHGGSKLVLLGNPWLWGALAISAAGMLCWLGALRHLSLSMAYPWTALIYVLTPMAGVYLFSEQLPVHYILGVPLILLGMVLTTRGVTPP